jgi:hypothetical protein
MNGKMYEKGNLAPVFVKNIAKIRICGMPFFTITEKMEWTPPTPEQIEALHDTFCIDVEILEESCNGY